MALPRNLLTHHWITATQALSALDRFHQARVPIGRLALQAGLLEMGPLLHVLDEQIEQATRGEPRRFGEIAVELGYLSERDVEGLLRRQRRESPRLEEVMLELGVFAEAFQWDRAKPVETT